MPAFHAMRGKIRIKKGLNIFLKGEAEKVLSLLPIPEVVAIQTSSFPGVIPKLLVKEKDEVKAGSPLFCDKRNESVLFTSPVSGEVLAITRGEKRRVESIKILTDKSISYLPFQPADPLSLNREAIIAGLLRSGIWPFIRQRPFGIIADPAVVPKSIFISGFDTNPLAPDLNFVVQGNQTEFQYGINALSKLTNVEIHLNLSADHEVSEIFRSASGVTFHYFSGPHPAGNVGVQIHHIDPINKGEVVWYLSPQDIIIIGRLFIKGLVDTTRIVACTGPEVLHPRYYLTTAGAPVKQLLTQSGLTENRNRIVCGNVLSGIKTDIEGYLGFYDSQLTVIAETEEPEFMGWLKPGFDKFSVSRTFFSWLKPDKKYSLNTLIHGEERPFVITGEYEKVFPMDIYPVQLLKSILIGDIDLMEKLGIYEVVEEDFALCEFVCTSKIESQKIIRRGLELIRQEFN